VTIGGVPATSVVRTAATTITAVTPPAGTAGAKDVVVTNNDGQTVTRTGAYTYLAVPAFTSIAPAAGPIAGGNSVTITGTGFTGATGVTFGGTAATAVTVVSDTQITATAPAKAAGAVSVVITTPGGTATGTNAYTYVAIPTFTSVAPTAGPIAGGNSVTITGTGFVIGATAVTFGGTAPTSFTVNSATSITAVPPSHAAGSVNLVITTPGGTVTGANAYRYAAIPTFTSIVPIAGPIAGGTAVTITGSGFTGATGVTFGGTAATAVTVVSDTSITATTPAHAAGSVDVVVTAPGGTATGTNAYRYAAVPTYTSIVPAAGPVAGGNSVTITGTGFTGATAVTFGGTAATGITVVSDTTITATAPAHAVGAVSIVVTTPGGTATGTNAYTYAAVPTFTSILPVSGTAAGGTSVTITGTGFTGATAVTFGGTAATSFTVVSATSITATTPAHAAGVVNVVITTPGGTATGSNKYTYV
jgi:hypothetical protein